MPGYFAAMLLKVEATRRVRTTPSGPLPTSTGASPNAFWLDSEHVEPGLDRFSFLGDASGPLAEVVPYRSKIRRGGVETSRGDRTTRRRRTILDLSRR